MTSRNRDATYKRLDEVLDFFRQQTLKNYIHTAMPAIVQSFDRATRRALIQPALYLLLNDGPSMRRPPLANVPVIFPSGGGASMLFDLQRGDTVLLIFSERGITDFKKTYRESSPERGVMLSMESAIALAGFGPLNLAPAYTAGAMLQTDDGETAVAVQDGVVRVKAGGHELVLQQSGLTLDGVAVGSGTMGGGTGTLADDSVTPAKLDAGDDTKRAALRLRIAAAGLASPVFTGTPTAPTPTSTGGETQIATKKYVDDNAGGSPTQGGGPALIGSGNVNITSTGAWATQNNSPDIDIPTTGLLGLAIMSGLGNDTGYVFSLDQLRAKTAQNYGGSSTFTATYALTLRVGFALVRLGRTSANKLLFGANSVTADPMPLSVYTL